mmetsp:Transcript_34592/g.52926  ORF Transcript_34592/g.52926 Transcript_34592/m.52926 type:complete len:80 (+) Transcript_34592:3653-3892(+)
MTELPERDAPESSEGDEEYGEEAYDEVPLILTADSFKNDPYLASAIEFMYDSGNEGAQELSEMMRVTWLEREKQFYGEI